MKKDVQNLALLDSISHIVWVTNGDASEVYYYNSYWWKYTGIDPAFYVHADAADQVHPEDLPPLIKLTAQAVFKQEGFETQYRLRSANGYYFWHLVRFSPLTKNAEGKIEKWIGTATNIDELIEAKSRFSAFFEQSSLPMEIYDLQGYPLKVNNAWVKLFDTNLDQLKSYNVLTDPQSIERGLDVFINKAIRGEAVEVPAFYYDPAAIGKIGRPRFLEASFFPVKDQNENVRELAMILKDVTDKEMIQTQLKDAVEARQEILNICSHELKTPLTSLHLQAQMTKRRIAKGDPSAFAPERMEKLIQVFDEQIERLIHLVDDMLDITRLNSGRMLLIKEKVVLAKVVEDVLYRFSDQLSAAGCTVSTQLDVTVIGEWDKFRIEQVLVNLLTNAFKYGAGKPIHVTIHQSADKKFAILTVTDQGQGISPADLQRIFDRFERASKDTAVSGLGLGLYITREIVELHGGKIHVQSELRKGSKFIVELPLT